MVFMNKRSILTAVLALGLGISALTGCATDSDSAHSYVTPKDVKTVERPIAQIDDSGVKVPEKRDLKVKLADSAPCKSLRRVSAYTADSENCNSCF